MEFCGYIGMLLFCLAAIFVFFNGKLYKSVVYFFKRRRKKRKRKEISGRIGVYIGFICMMAPAIRVQAEEKAIITITPVNACNYVDQIPFYDNGADVKIALRKEWTEQGEIQIRAVPQDKTARESAQKEGNGYTYEEGCCVIGHWETADRSPEEKEETEVIYFRFQRDGKWRVEFLCEIEEGMDGQERTYQEVSGDFVIDQTAPTLDVRYESCQNISSACSFGQNVNRVIERGLPQISSSDCEVFADGQGRVSLTIGETYFAPEQAAVTVFEMDYASGEKKDVTKAFHRHEQNKGVWEKQGDEYTLRYEWKKEGHFQFQIEYQDNAGHVLEAADSKETAFCMEEGRYQGPTYTVDQTAPVLKAFTYQNKAEIIRGERSYFKEKPVMMVKIIEENFNREDFMLKDSVAWADGSLLCPDRKEEDYSIVWSYAYEGGERVNTAVIAVQEEGNHTISGWAMDAAGNKSVIQAEACTYDSTPPEVELRVWGEDYFIPYKTYQYFGQKQVTVAVSVRDKISGVHEISYSLNDEKEQVLYRWENEDGTEKSEMACQKEIVICQEEFKGKVHVRAENLTGWKSDSVDSPGILVETKAAHEKNSSILLHISDPDYTDEKRKIKYYRNPITVRAEGRDDHAGIGRLLLQAANEEKKKDNRKKEEIQYEDTVTMRIEPSAVQKAGKETSLEIRAVLFDNAGNRSVKEYTEYRLVADSEKPEIAVVYDTNDAKNGKYYNHARTATVTVKDRNFNPEAVRWEIAGSNDKYEIGSWRGEGEVHQCQVNFIGDGKEYRLKVTVEDYAGNKALWEDEQSFTIDKTPPVITMEMEGTAAENDIYYSGPQKLTFHVRDKNVDPAKGGMYFQNHETAGQAVLLTETEKNHYVVSKTYKKDGTYQVYFQCMDLAGNVSKTEEVQKFIIDRTAPRVQITGVEDGMTYTGTVQPCVTIADNNLDKESVQVRLEKTGETAEKMDSWAYAVRDEEKKKERRRVFVWDALPQKEGNDGIYRLQIDGKDMAGNWFSLKGGMIFRVNRFGSVYVFQETLQDVLQRGYTKTAQDVVITEYSVDPVDTRITILKDNQEWRELYLADSLPPDGWKQKQRKTGDGKYAVLSGKISEGSKKGWFVKRHFISADNFKKEGIYQVTLESTGYRIEKGKKKILKETSSTLKGKPVYFIVDRTPPTVRIGGLEKKYYEGKTHSFVITVMDNFDFSYMDVQIWYEGEKEPKQVFRILPEDLKENHSVAKQLSAYEGWQSIRYQAWDRAGNCLDSEENGEQIDCVIADRKGIEEQSQNGEKKEKGYAAWKEDQQINDKKNILWLAIGFASLAAAAAFAVAVWKKTG